MIKDRQPLSLIETQGILKDLEETDKIKDSQTFIKKFTKLTPEKGKKIREEIEALNLLKLKSRDISKIIDLLPEDAIDVNKIFNEVSLDADETNKILDVVKANK